MSLNRLQNIGLTENEANLYDLLIKNGEVPVSFLISESKLKRPTAYKTIDSLKSKGLVLTRDFKKVIHVKPDSPIKLADYAQEELDRIENTKKNIDALLPSLALHYTLSTERPVVRTYEGIGGLKELYLSILDDRKPIYALLQAADVEPELYEWLTTKYIRRRVREKIHVKAIVASSRQSREYVEKNTEEFRIARLVDAKLFPFQHEIDIYGDKVAIINYKKNDTPLGIVIHHPQIAQSMKAWFDLAWAGTEK